ncbi:MULTISPECIES: DUF4193 domain-containing protein [Arthrobacter]|uniref:DUF4193 domain-containing protein n=1 Tax=Arthrobacter TaxID=1663 RepID=UPI00273C63A7|nr:MULTISPECIES: DUF4193 domain-containing protein [Arthrobacter]MDV8149017.1 DUF4193 domain-containing protein [Arthrobacter sp. B10-11]WLQ07482.1 DUF4193 domain-containing protein [Arthrobacter oryzae]
MATDYDAPRVSTEDEANEASDVLKPERSASATSQIDVDESDLADSFELPGADLSNEELLVQIIPVQKDEFTCMSCFLVHHRSQLAREKDGKMYCKDCEG